MHTFLSLRVREYTERHAARLEKRGFQRVSDLDLIEARLQGAARTRLLRPAEGAEGNEQEARNGSRKPESDDLPDPNADDLNYDCNDHRSPCTPAQAVLDLQALRRALHEAFPPRPSKSLHMPRA